ncbi:MAG: DNA polymerase III subunit beta [Bacilli bacterium]|jgi:DNA polymerase-3 subunit beta
MKFTINRDELLFSLNHVSKALSAKVQMPAMSGIMIEVEKEILYLTATNSDISIKVNITQGENLQIEETGSVLVPGKYLLDAVRKIDSKDITFAIFEETILKIYAYKSNISMNILDKTNFPMLAFDESNVVVNLKSDELKRIIRNTSFATSLSESKTVLMGVHLTVENNEIQSVATDSFRLAKKKIVLDKTNPKTSVIIPRKSLEEINRIVEDFECTIEIHLFLTKALIKYKNILFQTRLIEGVYPNTSNLIPENYLTHIKFNKTELINAIERTTIFTNLEENTIVKIVTDPNKVVKLNSINNEIGNVVEEIAPIDVDPAISFQIACSAKYLIEALKAFDSTEITIHFTGELKPFVLTGEKDDNLVQLIVPIRVV